MLSSIKLAKFKSFADAEVPLGPMTLLVGTNASGKSNVKEGLRFLHGIGLGYSLAEILGEKYGPGGILQWRGIRGGVREAAMHGGTRFELCAVVRAATGPRLRYTVQVDVGDDTSGPRVVRESLSLPCHHRYLFDSNPGDDPLDQRGEHQLRVRHPRGGAHRAHGKVSEVSSARPAVSQLVSRSGEPKVLRSACANLLEVFSKMRFLDLDPDAARQPSQPGQVVLGDRGENLSSVLQSICTDAARRAALLGWVRALTPMDATDLEFVHDLTGKVLVHLVESSGHKTSAFSASDGTLRFLALVAALLSPDSGQLYFFEEFDNGIHPTRLHLLLRLVQQLCGNGDVQVIGTTHNPAMLAFLDEQARRDTLLVYRGENNAVSRIRPIMELPEIERIITSQDLGRLHSAGWLEDAALFSEPVMAGD